MFRPDKLLHVHDNFVKRHLLKLHGIVYMNAIPIFYLEQHFNNPEGI